jgi:hypothetical protein
VWSGLSRSVCALNARVYSELACCSRAFARRHVAAVGGQLCLGRARAFLGTLCSLSLITIAIRNAERCLRAAGSALAQRWPNVALLLLHDESADASLEICLLLGMLTSLRPHWINQSSLA